MKLSPAKRYFLLGLGVIVMIAAVTFSDILQQQEMSAFDWLMRMRPARQVSPDIAVIAIDDSTIYDLGRWPLPRKHHALLIKALSEAGARLVVFDILLSEPSAADELLAQEIKDCGRVILPAAFRIEESSGSGAAVPAAQEILGAVTEQLKPAVKSVGHINIFVDSDGKVRRLPLNLRYADRSWPSLGLLAAADRLDIPAEKIRYPSNTFWINYPGPWKSFSPVSYSKVLRAYEAGQKGLHQPLDLNMFRGKICFVGLTAVGTTDLRANPLENIYPMVGVHASVCDSFLQGRFLKRLNPWARLLITLAAALAAGAICLSLSPAAAGVSCLALVAAFIAGAWAFLCACGIFTDIFLPVLLIASVYAAVLLHKFFLEAQRRKILEKELEIAASIQRSFLPPDLRQFRNVCLRTFLKPAKFVAGDFYDILVMDESTLGVFIGDVSGKGVPASLIMAQSISLLRVLVQQSRDPLQVMTQLNIHLSRLLKGRFVTGQFLVIHTKDGFWEGVCAGHPALFFYDRQNDKVEERLAASGPPLGLSDKVAYNKVGQQFGPGDKIFMYTDGWTEARGRRHEEFGTDRLREAFQAARGEGIDAFMGKMHSAHDAFESAGQHDDITAVALQF